MEGPAIKPFQYSIFHQFLCQGHIATDKNRPRLILFYPSRYCLNMETARFVLSDLGENNSLIQNCQRDLGHQLPLSSYLIKPIQRLTKYQLILKQLRDSPANLPAGKMEIDECLVILHNVIKTVNDSVDQPNIKGLPEELFPLGPVVYQETFIVLTENKSDSQILFRNSKQRRQVLIYDNYLVFCKTLCQKTRTSYHFKFCLALSGLGMCSIIKDEDKKMEVWISERSEVYRLEAKTKQAKENFALRLRAGIVKAKDDPSNKTNQVQKYVHADTLPGNSSSEQKRSFRPTFGRSKSLDHKDESKSRCQTWEGHPNRSCSLSQLPHNPNSTRPLYQVLADYKALSERELSLCEQDLVELLKTGCAGWWYVRLTSPPFVEGWAPSTYLIKIVD